MCETNEIMVRDVEIVDDAVTGTDNIHLTPTREKIMTALLNPEFIGLTVTEKCKRISVSRQAWYEAIHNEQFMELVNKTSLDVLKEGIAGVMAALLASASNPSSKCNADRRLFFELTGHTMKEFGGQNIVIVKIDG